MQGDAGDIAYFSGSVVVDSRNTAGFGAGARVAIYTLFDKATKNQSQAISYSSDGNRFQFYRGNPVLDIGATEFHDPTVFWYTPQQRWIMAVALALDRKIAFYASSNLKHWTWLSEFGPAGANDEAWECPDLIELPVDGDPARKKWVLIVSIDWTHERYFVGDFDGSRFRDARAGLGQFVGLRSSSAVVMGQGRSNADSRAARMCSPNSRPRRTSTRSRRASPPTCAIGSA
jgi:fructan beta-fructosidase